ncbi:unnamed protein product [Caenorhabditis sp. 36 PRJEB53466]|nr:unnamed protein product [Caenorhabditis sp. 36 PRJEB53466]
MAGGSEKRVFLDMSVDEKPVGRIEIKLFTTEAPKTCENFRALCTGEAGMASNNKARLHYKGNEMHRIVRKFMIQGGDITEGDGRGGYSIYGRYFDDEKFRLKHSKPYLLSMANKGPNSNSSQFFITTAPAPHCNDKHVVFGEVIKGQDVVDLIENLECDDGAKPKVKVVIANCGELVKKKKILTDEEDKAALEAKRLEERNKIPDCPKSWLYRNDGNDERENENRTIRRRDRSRESRRRTSRSRERRRDRYNSGDGRDSSSNNGGTRVRGRGTTRFRRERSLTPEHWKRNAPKKWANVTEQPDLIGSHSPAKQKII